MVIYNPNSLKKKPPYELGDLEVLVKKIKNFEGKLKKKESEKSKRTLIIT